MENLWLDLYRHIHHNAKTNSFHTRCIGKAGIMYLTHMRAYKGLIWSSYYPVLLLPPSNFQESWSKFLVGGVSIVYFVELGMRIFLPAASLINPFPQDTSKVQSAFNKGIVENARIYIHPTLCIWILFSKIGWIWWMSHTEYSKIIASNLKKIQDYMNSRYRKFI